MYLNVSPGHKTLVSKEMRVSFAEDKKTIEYVAAHSRTERALFNHKQLKAFFRLAGVDPQSFEHLNNAGFTAFHSDIADPYVEKATEILRSDEDILESMDLVEDHSIAIINLCVFVSLYGGLSYPRLMLAIHSVFYRGNA